MSENLRESCSARGLTGIRQEVQPDSFRAEENSMSEVRQDKPRKNTPEQRQPSISERERKERERGLDNTIEDSFPSSDPPSSIPNPGEEDPQAA